MRLTIFTLVGAAVLTAQQSPPKDPVLEKIRARMQSNLTRLPNFVCAQTVERGQRFSQDAPFRVMDTLRLEVTMVGGRERFSWLDSKNFEDRELADMVGRGTIGTGNFGLHARNVFESDAPDFVARGEDTMNGVRSIRYDFDIPREHSRFRIRIPPKEAFVPYYGSFWVNADTMDLIRLEVRAEDIPNDLEVARVSDAMTYERVLLGESEFLLPKESEFSMVGTRGDESRNRTRLDGCREFRVQSSVNYEEQKQTARAGAPESAPARAPALPLREAPAPRESAASLPLRTTVEMALDADIDPERSAIGDVLRAVVSKPVKHQDRVLVPEGAQVQGRLMWMEKIGQPFPHYLIGLQFHTIEWTGGTVPFTATLAGAGPANGLIKQEKRINPTFTRKRSTRFNILVNETHHGQGVLHWDARQPLVKRGLKMRWVVQGSEGAGELKDQ